ncbi:MAG: hypothetical protein M0R40_06530 [Firmicutes bacterium]|nr:hypothetical protein [Bacillota bacterium]
MRTKKIKQLHYDVLDGKTDYVPLIINTAVAEPINLTPYESMQSPEKHMQAALHNRVNDIEFPTDREIVVESNFLEALIPSMFGAQMHISPGGWIAVKPCFEELPDADELQIGKGLLDEAKLHLLKLKELCPENIRLAITRFMAPLDYAVVMRGGDFYMDLLLEPEKSMRFLNKIAEITIETLCYMKNLLDEDIHEQVTAARGLYTRGTRLTGDAVVNLSPKDIEQFLIPSCRLFRKTLSGLMLHYCCLPAPSGHVLPTLAKFPDVIDAVDNWQGVGAFFNKDCEGLLQDKVAMCFDISYDEAFDVDKLMEKPIFKDVPRKGGRGLFVGVNSPNLEASKRLYCKWQDYFEKHF